MEAHIVDYYNELPQMVHVIDKLNEEYETAMDTIRELQQENKRLKTRHIPPEIPDEENVMEAFEQKVRARFIEWCEGDLDNYEPLSGKLMDDYSNYKDPSYEDSLIKRLIRDFDDVTNQENPQWCELLVLTTIESVGITTEYVYWGYPMFEVEDLIESLLSFEIPLLSVNNM